MSRAGYWDFQTNSYSADDLCDTVAATKLEGTLMMLCIYQLTVIIPISTTHALSAHLRVGRVQSLLCCSVIDPCSAHQPVRCTLIVNNNGDSLFNGHCRVHSEMILPLAVLESHSRFAPLACPPIGLGGLTLVSTNWWCPVAAICPPGPPCSSPWQSKLASNGTNQPIVQLIDQLQTRWTISPRYCNAIGWILLFSHIENIQSYLKQIMC